MARTVVTLISTSGNVTFVITVAGILVIAYTCEVTLRYITICIAVVVELVSYSADLAAYVTVCITSVIPNVSDYTSVATKLVVTFCIAVIIKEMVNCACYLTSGALTGSITSVSIYVLECHTCGALSATYESGLTCRYTALGVVSVLGTVLGVTCIVTFTVVDVVYYTCVSTSGCVTISVAFVIEYVRYGTNKSAGAVVTNFITYGSEYVRSFSFVVAQVAVKVAGVGVNVSNTNVVTTGNVTNFVTRIGPIVCDHTGVATFFNITLFFIALA